MTITSLTTPLSWSKAKTWVIKLNTQEKNYGAELERKAPNYLEIVQSKPLLRPKSIDEIDNVCSSSNEESSHNIKALPDQN